MFKPLGIILSFTFTYVVCVNVLIISIIGCHKSDVSTSDTKIPSHIVFKTDTAKHNNKPMKAGKDYKSK